MSFGKRIAPKWLGVSRFTFKEVRSEPAEEFTTEAVLEELRTDKTRPLQDAVIA